MTSLAFSGCVSKPGVDTEIVSGNAAALAAPGGRDLGRDLKATDSLSGPQWRLHQWFGYHVLLGVEDTTGFHYTAVVTQDDGDKWFLATDQKDVAKYQAMFDFPILGAFGKKDLTTKSAGEEFRWYQFPMTDGSQWSWTLKDPNQFGDGVPKERNLVSSAKYNPKIATAEGDRPGFDIETRTADGKLFARYDYLPAIGWFAHLYLYNPDAADPEKEWQLHLMEMGIGTNWKGTYFVDEAKQLLSHSSDLSGDPEHPVVSPQPQAAFTMGTTSTYLHGFFWSYAFAGQHETILMDPHQAYHKTEASSLGPMFSFVMDEIDEATIAGDWRVITAGAGVAAGGGGWVFEITETTTVIA